MTASHLKTKTKPTTKTPCVSIIYSRLRTASNTTAVSITDKRHEQHSVYECSFRVNRVFMLKVYTHAYSYSQPSAATGHEKGKGISKPLVTIIAKSD